MWQFLVIVFAAAAFFVYKLWTIQTYWKNKGIPYERPVPLFGIMLPFVLRRKFITDVLSDLYRAYSNVRYFGCHIFVEPFLVIRDPEIIKQICMKDFDAFSEHRPLFPEEAEPLIAKTMFALSADKWRKVRPATSPVFTGSKIKLMFTMMEECSRRMADFYLKQGKASVDVELKDIFSRYTNDVIATATYGIECDSLNHRDNDFYDYGKDINRAAGVGNIKILLYSAFPNMMKFLKLRIFTAKSLNYFINAINEALKLREEFGVIRPDLIHTLLDARKNKDLDISYDDIRAQALIFFLGGFETVSTALSFTAYELALNEEIQERLHKEIEEVWRNENGNISIEAISRMKYMDTVVSEGLRKHPPMFIIDRKCVRPYTLEPASPDAAPLRLRPGQLCLIPAYSIHRDEKYYPDPERFDPERFSDENKANFPSAAYIPFGVGPRNCIGARYALLKIKTLLFHLVRNFKISPNKRTDYNPAYCKSSANLSFENGFHVSLKRRMATA